MRTKSLIKLWFLLLFISFLIASCEFRIVKHTGPQYSLSVNQAKINESFICEYTLSDSVLNGAKLARVFAEHQYTHDGGFFSKFNIDCCNSQLVLVTDNNLAADGRGFSVDWNIPGFVIYSSNAIYKNYQGINMPDSINLAVYTIDNKEIIQNITLYKVVND